MAENLNFNLAVLKMFLKTFSIRLHFKQVSKHCQHGY